MDDGLADQDRSDNKQASDDDGSCVPNDTTSLDKDQGDNDATDDDNNDVLTGQDSMATTTCRRPDDGQADVANGPPPH
jgi:hypothetical protein